MSTINYKDPSLLASISANGVMSSNDKNRLNALDGYASLSALAAETNRAQGVEHEIMVALDGYSGGGTTNLTNVLYVDAGTPVPLGLQNGNIETPFSTITAAVAALPSVGTVIIAPGNYSAESTVSVPFTTHFTNMAGGDPPYTGIFAILPPLICSGDVSIDGCANSGTNISIGSVSANNCSLDGYWIGQVFRAQDCALGNTPIAIGGSFGQIIIDHCSLCVNNLGQFEGLDPSTTIILTNTSIFCQIAISFFAPGGIVKMDGFTYQQWLNAPGTLTNGTIQVIGGGVSSNQNLTNTLYVDVGTPVSIGSQNGNIESPFATITQAVAATPKTNPGLVLVMLPGDYMSENGFNPIDLTGCGQTAFVNLAVQMTAGPAGSFPVQNAVLIRTIESNAMVTFQGCQILNAFPDSMQLRSSMGWGSFTVNSGFWAESSIWFNGGVVPSLTSLGGPVRFDEVYFQTGGDVIFKTDNVDPIELYRCTLTAAITIHFLGSPGILKLDNFTYQQWLSFGCTLDNGTIVVVDPSSSSVFLDGYATVAYVDGYHSIPQAHAPTHIAGGTDPLDGYHIPLTYSPLNYSSPIDGYIGEHIAKIDQQLGLNLLYSTLSMDVSLTALANVLIDTRPANPSGAGRWKLISIDIRVKIAISGSGSPSSIISVGSTSGGQQIVINQTIDGYKTVGTIVGGLALSSLGSDMSQSNGFEAVYPASQQMYANITPSGSPSTGTVTIYLVWQLLS